MYIQYSVQYKQSPTHHNQKSALTLFIIFNYISLEVLTHELDIIEHTIQCTLCTLSRRKTGCISECFTLHPTGPN